MFRRHASWPTSASMDTHAVRRVTGVACRCDPSIVGRVIGSYAAAGPVTLALNADGILHANAAGLGAPQGLPAPAAGVSRAHSRGINRTSPPLSLWLSPI